MADEVRLDVALVRNGLAGSRQRAKEMIEAGQVYLNGAACKKAAVFVAPGATIELEGEQLKYVGRGGLKLEKALQEFDVSPKGKVCIDFGASTGGFTDCLLQNEARKVYAVDVGTNQLAEKLRDDTRVISLERTNIRDLTTHQIPELADFACIDLSFISLQLVLPVIKNFLSQNADCIALVKPQFEAGKENVGKNGIVKSPKIHKRVLESTLSFAYSLMLSVKSITYSPIKGAKGNVEYLFHMENGGKFDARAQRQIDTVVNEAFEKMKTI